MKNCIRGLLVILALYLISLCQMEETLAAPPNGHADNLRNRARGGVARYHSRVAQYSRIKPDTFLNDLSDDDDLFDLTKRQQSNSDDYGHLRFGKRDEQFDDYGHMRFGRNGGEKK